MKHLYLLLFLVLCLLSNSAPAQWQWGLKGGVSISQVIEKRDGHNDSKLHFLGSKLIGLTLSRPIGRRFQIHNELQLATYGAASYGYVYRNFGMPYDVNGPAFLSMHHAGLSAKLRYYPTARFFASAGMEAAVLVQDNQATSRRLISMEHRVLASMGYALLPHLSFELRYNRSLSPFYEERKRSTGSLQLSQYNHAVQASLEYRFHRQAEAERPAPGRGLYTEWGGMAILNGANFIYYLQGSPTFRGQFEENPVLISKGVGLFFRRPVAARTLLHTELAYTSRGGKGHARTGTNTTADLMLSYLALAMAYEYMPWNKVGFQVGMEGARRFGSTYELSGGHSIRRWDISLLAGCRLTLPEVSFTLRYIRGLRPVIDARDTFTSVRQFNQGIQLSASVPFGRAGGL